MYVNKKIIIREETGSQRSNQDRVTAALHEPVEEEEMEKSRENLTDWSRELGDLLSTANRVHEAISDEVPGV